jgi:hypothetical protein
MKLPYSSKEASIMPDKTEITQQTKLAFDFIQTFYHEVSYLIKEIEAILSDEEEEFTIGKPAGYGISTRKSSGLEARSVDYWLMKKLAVFFVPKERIKGKSRGGRTVTEDEQVEGGQTLTAITPDLKVLYLRIVLNDRNVDEPFILYGVLKNIEVKPQGKWIKKFENLMGQFEYLEERMFKNIGHIEYEHAYFKLQGEFKKHDLFDINDSQAIAEKIVKPWLELYRRN